jgi:hypothetical protein
MYDRISLAVLLRDAGFIDIRRQDFRRSDIPDWELYDLDRSELTDRAIDPSVYLEGRKPGGSSGAAATATI